MPQEPKKRHSRQRQGKRRASISLRVPNVALCPQCKSPMIPHRVCQACGYYKGTQVIEHEQKTKKAPAQPE